MADRAFQVSWWDRFLVGLAPGWGTRRIQARMAVAMLGRHYDAASTGRRTDGWHRRATDANAASAAALPSLRELSRDLRRNNGWARRGIQAIGANTIGWGIVPKAAGVEAELAAHAQQVWSGWADSALCDYDGRMPFTGLQRLVMDTVVESGEALVVRERANSGDELPVPLRIRVLEPDYIDTLRDGDGESGPIVQGVELDGRGRRVAYWLYTTHPGSATRTSTAGWRLESERVPAENVLHVYSVERPGQLRGVPWLAAAIAKLHDFDDYDDAKLMQAKIAACFGAFVQDFDGAGTPLGEPDDDDDSLETLEPGHIEYLPPGKTVTFAQPPSTSDHGSFSTTQLRRIAVTLGVTYEDLTGDYCVAPDTRVLLSDLRWVCAGSLEVGDSIVAFDEQPPGGRGNRRKWRRATVERAGRRELPRRRIVTDISAVTVSDEHMFLCTARGPTGAARGEGLQSRSESPAAPGYGQRWVRADRLRPDDEIVSLCAPWDVGSAHTHGYLKGMADGEGYVDTGDAHIGIAQNEGPVFDEIGCALARLGIRATQRSANGGGVCQQWSISGIAECLRFLGEVRPMRLLEKAATVYEGRMIAGGAKKSGHPTSARVISIDEVGIGPVVTLGTSTGTLLTEGLCSHNSQVNFSSARMARLAHWANVYHWRWNMIIPQLCGGVWSWVMQLAAELEQWQTVPRAEWAAPPMPMLEPDKEGLAYTRLVRSGTMTLYQAIRERGEDPDSHLAEIAAANKKLDELGIVLDSDARRVSSAGLSQPVQPDTTD